MQKNKNFTIPFVSFAILSILFLFLWKSQILNSPSGLLSKISSGLRSTTVSAVDKNGNSNLSSTSKLVDQVKLEQENQALSDQFAVSNPNPKTLMPARVIGAPTFIPGVSVPDFFILDKGSSDGVGVGDGVVVANNLIGKISVVNSSSSKVTLITDTSISFTGKLQSEAVGVVTGLGDSLEIGNILLSENISKNSLVLTKGDQNLEGVGFPPDLVVGKIVSVQKNPSDLFQKAEIKSLVDFTKINMVFIVVK